MHDVSTWQAAIRQRLWELQTDRVGWGYNATAPPYTEPTVLACLALLASSDGLPTLDTWEAVHTSADFLRDLQQADGAVGVANGIATPQWPTAYAALLWSQVAGYDRPLARALQWLQQDDEAAGFFSDDQIVGGDEQPWRGEPIRGAGTHTIPAGMAILALCRNQLAGHARVRDGVRWILAGALPQGGWTADHPTRADSGTYPQAAATGTALLALRAANLDESDVVTDACRYLSRVLASIDSPAKFGWAWLGYHAWRPRTLESEAWLSRLAQRAPAREDDPAGLAMCLLAGSSAALAVLGVGAADGRYGRSTGLAQELLGV
jgi:hypothetical protein